MHHVLTVGKLREAYRVLLDPLLVGALGRELRLDLVVRDDPATGCVDEEHPARLEPTLLDDRGRVEVEHTGFAREHDEPVLRHPVPSRPQSVAVEHGTDEGAVGEVQARRSVPRFMRFAWYL